MVSGNLSHLADQLGTGENIVATFQIDQKPVRGRIAHMGEGSLNEILNRHDYPVEAARLLGEALVLAVLIGSSLKVDGRLTVQAEGDGPVRLMVAEYSTNGHVRATLRIDEEKWDRLMRVNKGDRPHPQQAIGKGVLTVTVIQNDPNIRPYQGVVPLSGRTLAKCAETYFLQSEQIPTRVKLAVGQLERPGADPVWQAGGALLQQIASDEFRGDTQDAWDTARALFDTAQDHELIDPDLSVGRLLYMLFHEEGVRLEGPITLKDACTCSRERLVNTLQSMADESLREMSDDGKTLEADCQFCGRKYEISLAEVTSN